MSKCVQCGYCCTRAVCPYGDWDEEAHQCRYLEKGRQLDGAQEYVCARYDFIRTDRFSEVSPAFGAGCSSSLFNTQRDAVVRTRRGEG